MVSFVFYYGLPIIRLQSVDKADACLLTEFLLLLRFQMFHRRSEIRFMCKWFCRIVMLTKLSCINRLIPIMQLQAYCLKFLSGAGGLAT